MTQTVLSPDKEAVWNTKELHWEYWCRHDTDATGPTPIWCVNNMQAGQKEASKWLCARCLAHVRLRLTVNGEADQTALAGSQSEVVLADGTAALFGRSDVGRSFGNYRMLTCYKASRTLAEC